jgi:hypothetical protein
MGAIIADRQARFLELTTTAEHAAATLDEILQRVADGEPLAKICEAWDQPYGRVRSWLAKDPEREAAYRAARSLRADALVDETTDLADSALFPQDKNVRINQRFRLAGLLDKPMYGDAPKIALSNNVVLKLAPEDERVL